MLSKQLNTSLTWSEYKEHEVKEYQVVKEKENSVNAHITEFFGIKLPNVYTFSAILQTYICKDDAVEAPPAVILGAGGKGINASVLQERS